MQDGARQFLNTKESMKPNETNQHKPPNQAVIEASKYAAEIFPDPTQQGTAVQFFLSQPWTATRNDVETFQRVRSTIDQWVSLPAHERIRWSWLTPKTPVPVCLCGSQCEVVDGTCVRCRYEKCLATRINDRIYDIYYEKDAAGRFVNQRFVWDAVHRYARVDGRPLADDILDDLYNKCWQQVTAACPGTKNSVSSCTDGLLGTLQVLLP